MLLFWKSGTKKTKLEYDFLKTEHKIFRGLSEDALWPDKPTIDLNELALQIGLDPEATMCHLKHHRLIPCKVPSRWGNKRLLVKIQPTPLIVPRGIETEMMAYRACDGHNLTPKFLGHVSEEGRVIGFIMEYIEGARMPIVSFREVTLCREALRRFYALTGWQRADKGNTRNNFLIRDEHVWLVDLSTAMMPSQLADYSAGFAEAITGMQFSKRFIQRKATYNPRTGEYELL